MNRLRLLGISTSAIGMAGLLFAGIPFIGSLKPSARAEAALPRIDISGIEPGTFSVLPLPISSYAGREFQWGLLVLRRRDGRVRVWNVPLIDGGVGMPDVHWWLPFYACQQFGPAIVDGRVDEASLIECRDLNVPAQSWADAWRWDLDGKRVGASYMDDMEVTRGVVEGRYFVYGKRG